MRSGRAGPKDRQVPSACPRGSGQFSGAPSPPPPTRVATLRHRDGRQAVALDRIVRIGGASGFWGDSRVAAPQLVGSGQVGCLVFDYLAEATMGMPARARQKRPERGSAADFGGAAMPSVLGELAARKIKSASNAGAIHPRACVT